MDEYTQRLVKRYGLDRQAHEMHNRIMHENLIKGFCERIESENKSSLVKFVTKTAFNVPYNAYGSSEESNRWYRNKEQTEMDYLQNMLKTWNLKKKNRERVAGLAAYRLVHSNYLERSNKGPSAQELLAPTYGKEVASKIIGEWRHWIDYYFDRDNDI